MPKKTLDMNFKSRRNVCIHKNELDSKAQVIKCRYTHVYAVLNELNDGISTCSLAFKT